MSKDDLFIILKAGFKMDGRTIRDKSGHIMMPNEVQAFINELKRLGLYETLREQLYAK